MKIGCKKVSKGTARGEAIVSGEPLSFLGGVDPRSGKVTEKGHILFGKSISRKVLIFPKGKGSTVGAYVLYQLKKAGKAPLAIINDSADVTIASGAIIAGIPMVHKLEKSLEGLRNGALIFVNADEGYIEVLS